MTTEVVHAHAVPRRQRAVARNPFFAVMSGVTFLIVIGGFAPTLYLRPIFKPEPIPPYLYLHGVVLTSWFVWFVVQSVLVQSGRIALHRKVGVIGACLAAVIPFAGLMATFAVVPRLVSSGISLDADATALGIGVSGPVVQFMAGVVWGNVSTAISFATLAWSGIALRRRPATHKRLLLLATIGILGPALARMARFPMLGGEQGMFMLGATLTLFVVMIIHDLATIRRVHAATVLGIAFLLVMNQVSLAVGSTNAGLAFVRWLQ